MTTFRPNIECSGCGRVTMCTRCKGAFDSMAQAQHPDFEVCEGCYYGDGIEDIDDDDCPDDAYENDAIEQGIEYDWQPEPMYPYDDYPDNCGLEY